MTNLILPSPESIPVAGSYSGHKAALRGRQIVDAAAALHTYLDPADPADASELAQRAIIDLMHFLYETGGEVRKTTDHLYYHIFER